MPVRFLGPYLVFTKADVLCQLSIHQTLGTAGLVFFDEQKARMVFCLSQCRTSNFYAIQAELRPVLLRRMKEDVENLPDKEEVVVWVELTTEQRHFYKAIYGKQVLIFLGLALHAVIYICTFVPHRVHASPLRSCTLLNLLISAVQGSAVG